MTRWGRILVAAALPVLGAACVSNTKVYDDSVRAAQAATAANPTSEQVQADTTAQARATLSQYQVASLSPGQRPATDSLEGGLWMQIDRAEGKVRTAGNRINDPALNAYVNGVVCRVALTYCDNIRTYIVRQPYFNASMSPNGMMQIWSGLLLRARNEAQLAAVIGHEIGHYLRRHSLQQFKRIRDATNGLVFFQIITAMAGVGVVGDIAALATIGGILSYSRDAEREADGYGLVLMGRAGYDPHEAAKIWAIVKSEVDAEQDEESNDSRFASTHPPTEERQAELTRLAPVVEVTPAGDPLGRDNYLAALRAYRTSFMRDEIKRGTFKPTKAVFDGLLEDGYWPALTHYMIGELYRTRCKDGDNDEALAAYERALSADDPPPETHRALGLMHRKAGERDKARAAFTRYLELAPEAKDAQMIRFMIQGAS